MAVGIIGFSCFSISSLRQINISIAIFISVDNQNKLSLTDTNINDTCDKMAAVLCDVHAIDGP